MSFTSFFEGKIPYISRNGPSDENDLNDLSKYEKIIEAEKQNTQGNTKYRLNNSARKAFQFSASYSDCYDRCSSEALRKTLTNNSLSTLIPDNTPVVPSKDLLTVDNVSGEQALADIVGVILDQNMSEPPKPNIEYFAKKNLSKHLSDVVRKDELNCEVKCAKKFVELLR